MWGGWSEREAGGQREVVGGGGGVRGVATGPRSGRYAPSAGAGPECAIFDVRKCAIFDAHWHYIVSATAYDDLRPRYEAERWERRDHARRFLDDEKK